ncbi:hypothetical protein L208DRAFT_1374451 [Tricholoma matsutake]|nr:hypothetical protein L208DRAFT_1374451 [Tricholoma matsutake 945]
MLAWVHQAITAEQELLESLFGFSSDGRMVRRGEHFFINDSFRDLNDHSLNPPLAMLDHAQILHNIRTVYQSSLISEDNTEQVASFEKILYIMVDPAVKMCATTSKEKKWVWARWDQALYILNCLSYLQNILEPFDFTCGKHQKVQKTPPTKDTDTRYLQFTNIMVDTGISLVAETCNTRRMNEPLSHIPLTQPTELQAAL